LADSGSVPAAGWYQDPWGQAAHRYWDGSQWTAHTDPDTQAAQQQRPAGAAVVTVGAPSAATAAESVVAASPSDPAAAEPAVTAKPAKQPAAEPPLVPNVEQVDDVALSDDQRAFLADQATLGKSLLMAFRWVGVVIAKTAAYGDRVARIVRYVPLLGFILWIYAIVATIAIPLVLTVASPLIALLLLPAVLVIKRPKVRADLDSGRAVRAVGTFVVRRGRAGGGFLIAPKSSLYLSSDEFGSLQKAHPGNERSFSIAGAMVRGARSGVLLGFYDKDGTELVGPSS
jgi:hypothetical protein